MFDKFRLGEQEQYLFLQLPLMLIKDSTFKKISLDAKVLYSLLLNRTSLSAKNGWVDDEGYIYIIYTIEQIMEDLNCWERRAVKAMKELKDIGLVESIRRGLGKPNILYVNNFATKLKSPDPEELKKGDKGGEITGKSLNCQNANSGICEMPIQEFAKEQFKNLRNANEGILTISNTDFSNIESMSTSDETEKVIHNQENDIDVDNDYELSSPNKDKEKEPNVSTADQSKETKSSTKNLITRFDEHDYNTYRKKLQENIEYSHFLQYSRQDISLIDELVDCMLDVIFTEGDTVKINGEMKNRQMVINQYLKINPADIELILAKYKEQQHKITHIHNYLKTILYNVKQEQGHFYTNAVTGEMEKIAMWRHKVNETENL